jgi:hypothetical protein
MDRLPVEEAAITYAPNVPPPITRKHPALVKADFTVTVEQQYIDEIYKYPMDPIRI